MRVKAGIFSLTPPVGRDDDAYLRWHLLDHAPEQMRIDGIQLGTRWIADEALRDARLAGSGPLAEVGSAMAYLVGDPVQRSHDDFMELGRRLAEVGRFPEHRPSLQVRLLALHRWAAAPAALVAAEVVPWRPHRGVVLIVEEPVVDDLDPWLRWIHLEHEGRLLDVDGVAGAWTFGSTTTWTLHPNLVGPPQRLTVVYLDRDPLLVTRALEPVLEERWASGAVRPLFAGPLRSTVRWDAWPE